MTTTNASLKSLFWTTLTNTRNQDAAHENAIRVAINSLIPAYLGWKETWAIRALHPSGPGQRQIGQEFIVDTDGTIRARVALTLTLGSGGINTNPPGISTVDLYADFSLRHSNGAYTISSGFKPGERFDTDQAGLQQLAQVVLDGITEDVRQAAVRAL